MIGQDPQDTRNFFLALGLSLAVLLAWQLLGGFPSKTPPRAPGDASQPAPYLEQSGDPAVDVPRPVGDLPDDRAARALPGASGIPSPAVGAPEGPAVGDDASRVPIRTASLRGSINLKGGRIDDVSLNAFREDVDPNSPNIVLFAPERTLSPYYADFGWASGRQNGLALPDARTLWSVAVPSETGGVLSENSPLHLAWDNGQGLTFHREYAVDDLFVFTVRAWVENRSADPVTLYPYALIAREAPPNSPWDYDGSGYYILHEGLIGVLGASGLYEIGYDDVLDDGAVRVPNTAGWIGMTSKYWAAAIIPLADARFTARFSAASHPWPKFQTDVLGAPVSIPPGGQGESTMRLFAGAKQEAALAHYQSEFGIDRFELLIDWGWFYFLTYYLFRMIQYINGIFGNFGVSILIATVIIKLAFFPLANKSYVSVSKLKKLHPKIQDIQSRFKDDRARLQQELAAIYKREKINPLAGCWPVLLQIPVFFALYKVLFVTIEMRHAPFFGWIKDLAAPDPTSILNLFGLLPIPLPAYLMIGAWPVLMGITMFLQMRMNPVPADPIQAKLFAWMPVIFTLMLGTFPAGLVIYWTWNNLLSVSQQYVIMRRLGVKVELWDNLRAIRRRTESR